MTSPLVEALSTLPLASKHIVLCLVAIGQGHVLTVPEGTQSASPWTHTHGAPAGHTHKPRRSSEVACPVVQGGAARR